MRLTRRALLAASAVAGAGLALLAQRTAAAGDARPIRPPGAADEDQFAGLCARCGNCASVCPTGIVRPDLGSAGPAGLLAPVLRFETGYCREDCARCTQVCPSGALRALDLPAKRAWVLGVAVLDESTCLMARSAGECSACLHCCPEGAITSEFDEATYVTRPVVDASKCNGCGACEAICPTRPTRSPRVVRPRRET